jgi:hypothetical protein
MTDDDFGMLDAGCEESGSEGGPSSARSSAGGGRGRGRGGKKQQRKKDEAPVGKDCFVANCDVEQYKSGKSRWCGGHKSVYDNMSNQCRVKSPGSNKLVMDKERLELLQFKLSTPTKVRGPTECHCVSRYGSINVSYIHIYVIKNHVFHPCHA